MQSYEILLTAAEKEETKALLCDLCNDNLVDSPRSTIVSMDVITPSLYTFNKINGAVYTVVYVDIDGECNTYNLIVIMVLCQTGIKAVT